MTSTPSPSASKLGCMTGTWWCSAPPARPRRDPTRQIHRHRATRPAASIALTPRRTFTTSALQTLQQRCIGVSMPVRPDSDRCPNSAATRRKSLRTCPTCPAPPARKPTPPTCRTKAHATSLPTPAV
eukprot:4778915-Prymnesium_polylepis.1